jgi:spore germination cell wall hydrolase CwlJ-like protein
MKLINPDALGILTIWQEARGEPYEGKVAVGEVIRNRMARCYSSDGTVAGTIGKPYQFSGWNTLDPNFLPSLKIDDTDPVVAECIRAWYESRTTTHAKGAVLYCNMNLAHPFWARDDKKVATIGSHSFFMD